jgi:hypothetical protein
LELFNRPEYGAGRVNIAQLDFSKVEHLSGPSFASGLAFFGSPLHHQSTPRYPVPRLADAVALGEADETWPRIIEDAARGTLKDVYAPVHDFGQERKPSLQP